MKKYNKYDYKNIRPFKFFMLQNFPFIIEDFDALTNYELMCKLAREINKVIETTNLTGEELEKLSNSFIELQKYVEDYFSDLNLQTEVDNKLDEMAESGELAEIINVQIFENLNNRIDSLEDAQSQFIENTNQNIEEFENSVNETMYKLPWYNILKNGGVADGQTPIDEIVNTAKSQGYKNIYFPQNETNNAEYYFENNPNFNGLNIKTDENVILNVPQNSYIMQTKDAIFVTNVITKSRNGNVILDIPKNTKDLFNMTMGANYTCKDKTIFRLSTLALYRYKYGTSKLFEHENKSNYFAENNYEIKPTNNGAANFDLLCVPLQKDKNECIEAVVIGSQPRWGYLDSNTGQGVYGQVKNDGSVNYYRANGSNTGTSDMNFNYNYRNHTFNEGYINLNWGLYNKVKLRNCVNTHTIQVYLNDILIAETWYGFENPNYFGISVAAANNNDASMSVISRYYEDNVPNNANLNILLTGDSRTYGFDSAYQIEDIIKNNLEFNGINKVNIDNVSVSGVGLSSIKNDLQNRDLSTYDIVIVCAGINDASNSYGNILQNTYDIVGICKNANCYCIIPACMPTCSGGTDALRHN